MSGLLLADLHRRPHRPRIAGNSLEHLRDGSWPHFLERSGGSTYEPRKYLLDAVQASKGVPISMSRLGLRGRSVSENLGACRSTLRAFAYFCIVAGAFIVVSSTSARADKQYPVSILILASSPVTLTKCEVWARDANKTILYTHASLPNALLDLGVAFTNTSDKPVTALRVELTSYDSFNTALRTSELDSQENRSADKMSVAPGGSFDLLGPRSWHARNAVPNRDHVSCAITAVKFADGTVWTAGSSPPSQHVAPTPGSLTPPSESSAPGVSSSPRATDPQATSY